jgi:hypothetical protein
VASQDLILKYVNALIGRSVASTGRQQFIITESQYSTVHAVSTKHNFGSSLDHGSQAGVAHQAYRSHHQLQLSARVEFPDGAVSVRNITPGNTTGEEPASNWYQDAKERVIQERPLTPSQTKKSVLAPLHIGPRPVVRGHSNLNPI